MQLRFLLNYLEVNQVAALKEDELWLQDQTQAADESHIQPEPMAVHIVVNRT